MKTEFEELQEENNNWRMKLAGLMADMKPKQQNEVWRIVNEIIDIEIELEKLCH